MKYIKQKFYVFYQFLLKKKNIWLPAILVIIVNIVAAPLIIFVLFFLPWGFTSDMSLFDEIEEAYEYAREQVEDDFKVKKSEAYSRANISYTFTCSNKDDDVFLEKGLLFLYYLETNIDKNNEELKEGISITINGKNEKTISLRYFGENHKNNYISSNIYGNYDNMYLFENYKKIISAFDFTPEQIAEIKEKYPEFEVREPKQLTTGE